MGLRVSRASEEQKTCLGGAAPSKLARVRGLLTFGVAILACGCASATPPPVAASSPRASSASSADVPPAAPASPTPGDPHRLTRSSVKSVVSQGLGFFLQQVDLDDEPAVVDGKFRGFRIAGLHGARFWSGVDLKPGDVVTGVNGLPIERLVLAQAAFDSVASASELRVSYDRDGQPRELVYRIVDSL